MKQHLPPDESTFPAESYKKTVLTPLFDGVKRHHWKYLMRINYAHGVMLSEQNILSQEEARLILGALRNIEKNLEPENLVYTGEHEDAFFYVESELKKKIGDATGGKLHTGRSRNDIDHTVFKMALKDHLNAFIGALIGLVEQMISVAEKNLETIIIAYTHGQPAQPTSYGHYLGAMIEVLLRDLDRLVFSYKFPDQCSMGAAAITTTGFKLNRARIAELLGFSGVQQNSYGCIASCDYVTSIYSTLKVFFLNIGRFIQDMNSWSGFETAQLYVPNSYVQISSIMPQKRNPVPLEHLRLMSSLASGRCDTVLNTMHNTPFTDMNDSEGEVQIAGYEAFTTGHRILELLTGLIGQVQINEEKIQKHIEESCITITELADTLVRTENISFRDAHEVCSILSRKMMAQNETLTSVSFEVFVAVFSEVIGNRPQIKEDDFRRFTTPKYFIEVRELPGGPAPAIMQLSLRDYQKELNLFRGMLEKFYKKISESEEQLKKAVDGYL